ncbi:MAG: SLC13 family permease, partial [Gemmatimonadota bacterium]
MGWQAWLTLAVLAGTVLVLARDRYPPSAVVLAAVVLLLVVGVITPGQAFSGFSNAAPITVAALYVVARGVEKTGALQPLVAATLGTGQWARASLARLLVPTAAVSGFMNNTPLVAILAPQVRDWADRRGLSPSRFLMPLSFAAILGGTITVIGTSTNLVVSGLLEAHGLPVAAAGLLLVVVLAPWVLPERRPARRDLQEDAREFAVQILVAGGGPLDGKVVEEGGLRHLEGVYLVEIERDGELIAPVPPTTVLRGGDRLTFVGRADLVLDLQKTRGLRSAEEPHLSGLSSPRHTFFEAVIGETSPLVGKTLKEVEFRGRYGGAVVAIHRAGQRVKAKLGAVRLKLGDTLLVLADPGFRSRWYDRKDFLLVSRLGGSPPASTRQAWL